ncbi:hypothetical protein GC098_31325 [Paenibacillus sp. LMG 31458]|uniref:Uncharacterized protein n=1 Tax=Paenibacillus phytorum TaxID=2654977 RepID=A0ABX1Y4Q2_9BACL|nr:hypothetical protein [Paenibacillus phytorum]
MYNKQRANKLELNFIKVENKIVLSIATRINAEVYMIQKIKDPSFVSSINSNQTGKLFGRFKNNFSRETEAIKILEKVNLMTPENIHLNSFMYEPILDLSEQHLKDLYKSIKELIYAEEITLENVAVAAENLENDQKKH